MTFLWSNSPRKTQVMLTLQWTAVQDCSDDQATAPVIAYMPWRPVEAGRAYAHWAWGAQPAHPSLQPGADMLRPARSWHQAGWKSRGHGFGVPRPSSAHSVDVAKITCVVPLRISPKDHGNPRVRHDDRLGHETPWKKYWKSGNASLQGLMALSFFFLSFMITEPNF